MRPSPRLKVIDTLPFPATIPTLARALEQRDFHEPTPVQLAVLQPEAKDRDLLVSAQTGSGKTVAYGLAFAATLLEDAEILGPAGAPLALVIAPTRELALQVQRELSWLYAGARARVVSCVGGMDPRRERRLLQEGAHIVVGTPGRLRDHLERRGLDVSQLRALVLDEADEMLDLGFREDLEEILKTMPDARRTLLFSATLPKGIVSLARDYQKDALRLEVGDGEERSCGYRISRSARASEPDRPCCGQSAALLRVAQRDRFLQYARGRASHAVDASRTRLQYGGAVGRVEPE